MRPTPTILITTILTTILLTSCDDTQNPSETNENELITTVELTFDDGTDTFVATWEDLEADGSPDVDAITLDDGATYTVTVRFLNALEDPVEDISEEVAAEADEHQVFVTGPGVDGPASTPTGSTVLSHDYVDADNFGVPLGLEHTLIATAGTTDLTITLQHLPEESGVATKTPDLAATVRDEGFGALPGDTDASVTFAVTVQ